MRELEILFRDQWLIAVNKPSGMLVHPGKDVEPSEVIAQKVLRDQIGNRVNTLHRLDRPTSGVLLFSLSSQIDAHMRQLFDQQEVNKTYIAVVHGTTDEHWTCDHPLQKDNEAAITSAETQFKKIGCFDLQQESFSILEAKPKTGRFHQIRKHLAMVGHPIIGDFKHGEIETMTELELITGTSRLMLHAKALAFTHPINSEDIYISAPLPPEFVI